MTTVLKMNRNRQLKLPSALVARLNLGEGRYFKAELDGNRIVLTPVKGPRFARPPARGLKPRAGTASDTPGKPGASSAVDPVERVFTQEDLDLVEETFQREKHTAKPVTEEWIRKVHRLR